jgi:tRNA A37 methylthiotransferase MiaB
LLHQVIEKWLAEIDIVTNTIVGFSVSSPQLLGSLLLAKQFKSRNPSIKIVFGGSFAGMRAVGVPLLQSFPFLDVVVFGEGEKTLLELVGTWQRDEEPLLSNVPGIAFHGRDGKVEVTPPRALISDLNELPMADHSDFLSQLDESAWQRVLVPIQTARGCSWNRCSFCENPSSWGKIRYRDPERVVDEILAINQRYKLFVFYLVDQEITGDVQRLSRLCDLLIKADRGLAIWGHARARPITLELARKMKRAGFVSLQIGIESFSGPQLRKLRKDATPLDNIVALRCGAESGIRMQYNLIAGFPGETREDVETNLSVLRLLRHFNQWGRLSGFVLQEGTHVHKHPQQYGIVIQSPSDSWSSWSACFPSELQKVLGYTEFEFKPQQQVVTEDIWRDISTEVSRGDDTQLLYLDAGEQMLVVDSRDGYVRSCVLDRDESRILRFCNVCRRLHEIVAEFPENTADRINHVLQDLIDNKLMYGEKDRFISLVLPGNGDELKHLVTYQSLL